MGITAGGGAEGDRPWCSLVTVTYNSSRTLQAFWAHTGGIPSGVEWIVVDNDSADDSAAVAERLGARVIRLSENRGFSAANNAGLAVALGDFVGFVNPDVRVDFGDLPSLDALARENRSLVSPQLRNADGSLQPNGRGYPFLLDKVRNRLGAEDRLSESYLLFAEGTSPRPVVWLMGASVFGRREEIDRIGGWDPHFFLYYEDKDICLRAWRAGIPVILDPRAIWTHGWARETSSLRGTPWKREIASLLKFYRRYPEFLGPRSRAARKHPMIGREVYGVAS